MSDIESSSGAVEFPQQNFLTTDPTSANVLDQGVGGLAEAFLASAEPASQESVQLPNDAADSLAKVFDGEPEASGLTQTEAIAVENTHNPFYRRLWNHTVKSARAIRGGMRSDFIESDNRPRTVLKGLGAAATQGFDRARFSVVMVPTIAIDVFKNTQSPADAGLAAAGAFAVWCGVVGKTLSLGLEEYPATVKATDESYPGVANFLSEGLAGFDEREPASNPLRAVASETTTRLGRGLNVFSIGNTAYVGAAHAKEKSKQEIDKLIVNTSIDGGLVTGGIVAGAIEIIQTTVHSPELALRIENNISDTYHLLGLALVMTTTTWGANKIKKIRQSRAQKQQDAVNHDLSVAVLEEQGAETRLEDDQ